GGGGVGPPAARRRAHRAVEVRRRSMSDADVWITGVGAVTPYGVGADAFAEGLLAARSAVARVTSWAVREPPCQIAAAVGPVPCPEGLTPPRPFASLRRADQFVLSCLTQALRDAGLWEARHGLRVGLVLGLGAEQLLGWEADEHAGR